MSEKTPEQMIAEGIAHRNQTAPNCAGCKGYHGSENALIRCLTAAVLRHESNQELQELRRFKQQFLVIKAQHDFYPMTTGGVAAERRAAGKKQ
jgi:hypothetical protein